MNDIYEFARAVFQRLGELDRRVGGFEMRGRVTEVFPDEHKVIMTIGKDPEGNPVLSPKIPVQQMAGALKLYSMPSVGQQVAAWSANGDIEQAMMVPLHWSEGLESPGSDPKTHIMTYGQVRVTLTEDDLTFVVGDTTVLIAEGEFRVTTPKIVLDSLVNLGGEGGKAVHRVGDADSAGDVAVGGASRVFAV